MWALSVDTYYKMSPQHMRIVTSTEGYVLNQYKNGEVTWERWELLKSRDRVSFPPFEWSSPSCSIFARVLQMGGVAEAIRGSYWIDAPQPAEYAKERLLA